MKYAKAALIALSAATLVAGCNRKVDTSWGFKEPVTPVYTDPKPVAAAQPAAQPVAQPVVYDSQPTGGQYGYSPTQPGMAGGAMTGGTYTVKKGDTLFSIAKSRYGNGNQWQKIAAANPGVSPQTLKAGQTIVIP